MNVPRSTNGVGPMGGEGAVESGSSAGKTMSARRGMLGLTIAAAIVNVLAAPLARMVEDHPFGDRPELFLGPMLAGVVCGEVGAMAFWLVWSEGTFLRRLAVHWGLALGMGLCLFGGVLLASARVDDEWQLQAMFEAAASVGCVLPAASLAVQLPLWPFRTHLGWRVTTGLDVAGAKDRQALSILDILVGTALVALSLGLIRFLGRGNQSPIQHLIMMQVLVSGLGLTLTSFVLLVPAMMLLLRMRSFGAGACIYFGSMLLSIGGLIVIPSIIFDRLPPAEGIFATLWGSFVFAATVAAPLFVWRGCGYRLRWPRDRRSE